MAMNNAQITTLTVMRFDSKHIWWMLSQMQLAQEGFRKIKGLQFFKLMGSGGKSGFSILPNLRSYALACVWESEARAEDFFTQAPHFLQFKDRARECWTVFMRNVKAHGQWGGQNPFSDFQSYTGGPIAVITRATIKWQYMRRFWTSVPRVSDNLHDHEGLLFSIGIGEYPLFMQATFSVWQDRSFMQQYAYQSKLHNDVIKKTRALGWYREEMFANFIPYKTAGTWKGKDPLNTIP
jgi:hypothetical protein